MDSMDFLDFGTQLVAPLPAVHGLPGDRIMVRLWHPEPIALCRILPPCYALIRDALERGILLPLDPAVHPARLIHALTAHRPAGAGPHPDHGGPAGPAGPRHPGRSPPHLHLWR